MEISKNQAVYRIRTIDGAWEVFDRAENRVSQRMPSQAEAVVHAKELARRGGSAQIIVHDPRGHVVSEFVYQEQERPSLAYDDSSPMIAASHAVKGGEQQHGRGSGSRR